MPSVDAVSHGQDDEFVKFQVNFQCDGDSRKRHAYSKTGQNREIRLPSSITPKGQFWNGWPSQTLTS
jgi:hypothetical protein